MLLQCDMALAGRAETLRAMVEDVDGARCCRTRTRSKRLQVPRAQLRERQAMLQVWASS